MEKIKKIFFNETKYRRACVVSYEYFIKMTSTIKDIKLFTIRKFSKKL